MTQGWNWPAASAFNHTFGIRIFQTWKGKERPEKNSIFSSINDTFYLKSHFWNFLINNSLIGFSPLWPSRSNPDPDQTQSLDALGQPFCPWAMCLKFPFWKQQKKKRGEIIHFYQGRHYNVNLWFLKDWTSEPNEVEPRQQKTRTQLVCISPPSMLQSTA